ncbi:MAG: decarboxylating 6-phosphogluconate dehydrogenase [Candidatus Paceibacterota bacterium]
MKIGYIGLGKMGLNMVERLVKTGHQVSVSNRSPEPIKKAESLGAKGFYSYEELVKSLKAPRLIWIMVSHQAVDEVIERILPLLSKGDLIVDGGNSPYLETIKRAKKIEAKGFKFMDVGTSGGPGGAKNGACLMIGGRKENYEKLKPLFKDLSVKDGFGYFGRAGAGHFVKMVHNGIEYGMMQAIGEGFEVMKKSGFDLPLEKIASIYNRGSVIESRLVGWLESAYKAYGEDLKEISGEISHSGEGQWTVEVAKRLKVPVPIIKGSLDFRVKSKGHPSYTGQVVSALRNQFGGHKVDKK